MKSVNESVTDKSFLALYEAIKADFHPIFCITVFVIQSL